MDTRKRLYKTTSNGLTLTERVKKDRGRQNVLRNNRFNANRNIHVDLNDSTSTPTKPAPIKISQIKDKPAKLKAYIEQKRTNKLKEQLEQRSPFIPYVPTGRWVEKKDPVKKPKAFTINTPIRKALMSDGKILKKSTIKQIATTAKKENVGASKQNNPVTKSRKKILAEFNDIQNTQKDNQPEKIINDLKESPQILDETFELITSDDDNPQQIIKSPDQILVADDPLFINDSCMTLVEDPLKNDNLLPEPPTILSSSPAVKIQDVSVKSPVVLPAKKKGIAIKSPKAEKTIKETAQIKKSMRQKKTFVEEKKAKIVIPVIRPNREKVNEKKLPQSKKEVVTKKNTVKKGKPVQQAASKSPEPVEPEKVPVKASKKSLSHTYLFYKSFLDNQVKFLSIQLKAFTNNLDNFIDKLPEETQINVHKTIQQGNLLINEKSKSFEDILEKFENADPLDSKRITEEDVENYWTLLHDQVAKFKGDLQYAQEAKTFAMKAARKSLRKTLSETPSRRSRRIAESSGTPKHNSSTCFACTPMSASKINTPKSAKKRRGTFKKSIAFDLTSEK